MSTQERPELSENEQMARRREKLTALREVGNAFPNDFRPTDHAAELHGAFDETDGEALAEAGREVSVAGRIMTRRIMGKASFATVRDGSGDIQLYVRREALPEGFYNQQFKKWDIGDIVGATGKLFKTRTGELSIEVDSIKLLTKALRPLPEKWHGLSDQELRYRQRYLDLIVNDTTRQVFRARATIVDAIRAHLKQREFLEVETPMMQPIAGGAAARPFVTHHNALDMDLYLRIAPELYLKRLTVGGFERVFEINRNFRNEGLSTQHNPEFTMLEFYWAYADFNDLMDLTEDMFTEIAIAACGSTTVSYQGLELKFGGRFERISVRDSILRYNPDLTAADIDDLYALRAFAERLEIPLKDSYGLGKVQIEVFDKTVEHKLEQPTFVTAYPTEVSPLSRRNDDDPFVTDRFELFIAGREIANGFSELNDAEDQAERFMAQVASREQGDDEAMLYDEDYVTALEYGLPPTAGEGVGIDRLTMLLTDSPSIRDVLLFPHMRPRQ
jgi:lysyl-tRNA synthetase class 2